MDLFEQNKDTWEEQEAYTKLRDFAQTRIEEIDGAGEGGDDYYDEEGGDDYGDEKKDGEGEKDGDGDGDDYYDEEEKKDDDKD